MLRSQLIRVSLPAHRSLTGAGRLKRGFGSSDLARMLPPVPILRPTLWAIAATATIYVGCATYEVYRETRIAKQNGQWKESVNSYDDLVKVRGYWGLLIGRPTPRPSSVSKWFPTEQVSSMMKGHSSAENLTICISAFNVGLVGAGYLAPNSIAPYFHHVPALGLNYTLLTSAFGHHGIFHVMVNTFMLLQFTPEVAKSRVFRGNGSHFAAFYLSAGILSSLGNHIGTVLPTRKYRFNRLAPAAGASGVCMALLGAWATINPDQKVGILFVPGSYAARDMVGFIALVDLVGFFIGIPYLHFAHAAHLAGLAFGHAYVRYDARNKIWIPTCRSVFTCMKRLKM
ncbi:hypothetical protein F4804DRAFT_324296, partial [Jackrogersella minutella]